MGLFSFVGKPFEAVFGSHGGLFTDPIGFLTGEHAASAQNATQERFWNMQNVYNTPKAQMQRFDEAGLNPNLIYTQGNSGNASSVGTAAAPEAGATTLGKVSSSFSAAMAARNMLEQNKNLQKQNTLIDSQTSVSQQQARKQALENAYFEKYGQWPAQESGFVRGTKSLVNYVPELYFKMVDLLDDVLSKDTFTRGRLISRGDNGGR